MINKTINATKSFSLVFLFLIGDIMNICWQPAGAETWMVYFAGLALALPAYMLYARVCEGGFFRNLRRAIGKWGQKIVLLVFAAYIVIEMGWIAAQIGLFCFTFNDFILRNDILVVSSLAAAVNLALLSPEDFSRYCEMSLWVFAFGLIISSFSGNDLEAGRLFPLLVNQWGERLLGTTLLFLRPFSCGFIAISILAGEGERKKVLKGACWAAVAAAVLLAGVFAKCVMLVGYRQTARMIFPIYTIAELFPAGNQGVRTSDFLGSAILIASLVKLGAYGCFSYSCLSSVIGEREPVSKKGKAVKKTVLTVLPFVLAYVLMVLIPPTVSNILIWLDLSVWPLMAFMVLLPVAVWIAGMIKQRKKQTGK